LEARARRGSGSQAKKAGIVDAGRNVGPKVRNRLRLTRPHRLQARRDFEQDLRFRLGRLILPIAGSYGVVSKRSARDLAAPGLCIFGEKAFQGVTSRFLRWSAAPVTE